MTWTKFRPMHARTCVCVFEVWIMMVGFFLSLFFAIVRHQYRTSDRLFRAYGSTQLHSDSFIGRRKRWCKLVSGFFDPHCSRAPVRTINTPLALAETVTASDSGTIFAQFVGSVIFQPQSSQNQFQISVQLLFSYPPSTPRLARSYIREKPSDCMLMQFYLGAEFPPEAQTLAFGNKISSQLSPFPIFPSFALSSRLPPFAAQLLSCSGPSVPHIIISENTNTTTQMLTATSFHWMNS